MIEDLSSEETTVVAAYPNRHDAETAKSFLESRGIDAFVAADEVHPPLQLTEGSRLYVLARDADEAFDSLKAANMLAQAVPIEGEEGVYAHGDDLHSIWKRVTGGGYVGLFVLVVIIVIVGLLVATFL